MSDISSVSFIAKARAFLVFWAIDSGVKPEQVWQHKLRGATKDGKWLYYNYRSHCSPHKCKHTPFGFRAIIRVRRDSFQRLYVEEVKEIPKKILDNWIDLKINPEKRSKVSDEV